MSDEADKERIKTRVDFDYRGYACAGGDVIGPRGYLWMGGDGPEGGCYTHTTSLRSLRKLRDLCDALVKAREASLARAKKRRRARGRTK